MYLRRWGTWRPCASQWRHISLPSLTSLQALEWCLGRVPVAEDDISCNMKNPCLIGLARVRAMSCWVASRWVNLWSFSRWSWSAWRRDVIISRLVVNRAVPDIRPFLVSGRISGFICSISGWSDPNIRHKKLFMELRTLLWRRILRAEYGNWKKKIYEYRKCIIFINEFSLWIFLVIFCLQ